MAMYSMTQEYAQSFQYGLRALRRVGLGDAAGIAGDVGAWSWMRDPDARWNLGVMEWRAGLPGRKDADQRALGSSAAMKHMEAVHPMDRAVYCGGDVIATWRLHQLGRPVAGTREAQMW